MAWVLYREFDEKSLKRQLKPMFKTLILRQCTYEAQSSQKQSLLTCNH